MRASSVLLDHNAAGASPERYTHIFISSIDRIGPQSPASDVDSAEFACKLLILPLFWRDGSFHPRGAGGREWRIGWISRSTLNWKPGWSPGMRGFPDLSRGLARPGPRGGST